MRSAVTKGKKPGGRVSAELELEPPGDLRQDQNRAWTRDACPACGYARADVDPDGILWCPACGYSKKGCYT